MSLNNRTVITKSQKVSEGVLVSLRGPNVGREYILVGTEVKLGRGEECDIMLRDINVSRCHARLRTAQGKFLIRDEKSKNGLYINGKRVQQTNLKDGDLIGIGDSLFRFRFGKNKSKRSRVSKVATPSRKIGDFHAPLISNHGIRLFRLPKLPNFSSLRSLAKPSKSVDARKLLIYASVAIILLLLALPLLSTKKAATAAQPATPQEKNSITVASRPIQDVSHSPVTEKVNQPIPVKTATAPLGTPPKIVVSKAEARSRARQAYSQGVQAMAAGDYRRALDRFNETIGFDPSNDAAKSKLDETTKRLSDMIQLYYNTGLREFTNLYYEKAIHEWEKVAALSEGFDANYRTRALKKINEAKAELLENR